MFNNYPQVRPAACPLLRKHRVYFLAVIVWCVTLFESTVCRVNHSVL